MASLSYNDCCVKSFPYGENLEKLNLRYHRILQTTYEEVLLFLTHPQSPSLCEPATPSEANAVVAGARVLPVARQVSTSAVSYQTMSAAAKTTRAKEKPVCYK